MNITHDAIGMSKEEFQSRVVDAAAAQLLGSDPINIESGEYTEGGKMASALRVAIREQVDAKVKEIIKEYIAPGIDQFVSTLKLHPTNKWGEKKGETLTLTEYLLARVETFMTEKVNYKGQAQSGDSYSWQAEGTRIQYLIHEHLQYQVSRAVEQMLKKANSSLATGLAEAVKIKLDEISKAINVSVTVGKQKGGHNDYTR